MITSFTDPRLRVWNVGDNAICEVVEGDQAAAFPCYIGTIAEHVNDSGVRYYAADVFVAIPATPRFELRILRFGSDRLYTSFPSYLREITFRSSDVVDLRNGEKVLASDVVNAIRGASRSLRFETFQTLVNWHTFLVDLIAHLERDDGLVAVREMLRGLFNAIAAEGQRRDAAFERSVRPSVTTSTNTTSTTNTTNTTPPPDVRHPHFEQQPKKRRPSRR